MTNEQQRAPESAAARVATYLDALSNLRGADKEVIANINGNPLLSSDHLRAALAAQGQEAEPVPQWRDSQSQLWHDGLPPKREKWAWPTETRTLYTHPPRAKADAPTDAELVKFAAADEFLLFCDEDEFVQIARAVLARYGSPQAAADKRDAAIREACAMICDSRGESLQKGNQFTAANEAGKCATAIRLCNEAFRKFLEADKRDAKLSDEQIEAAAQVLASCMDYPWDHMPEEGRKYMRRHAQTIVDAALSRKGGE